VQTAAPRAPARCSRRSVQSVQTRTSGRPPRRSTCGSTPRRPNHARADEPREKSSSSAPAERAASASATPRRPASGRSRSALHEAARRGSKPEDRRPRSRARARRAPRRRRPPRGRRDARAVVGPRAWRRPHHLAPVAADARPPSRSRSRPPAPASRPCGRDRRAEGRASPYGSGRRTVPRPQRCRAHSRLAACARRRSVRTDVYRDCAARGYGGPGPAVTVTVTVSVLFWVTVWTSVTVCCCVTVLTCVTVCCCVTV
jgi:hypothetical protein